MVNALLKLGNELREKQPICQLSFFLQHQADGRKKYNGSHGKDKIKSSSKLMNSKVLWRKLVLVMKKHFPKVLAFHFIEFPDYTQTCPSLISFSNRQRSLLKVSIFIFQCIGISHYRTNDDTWTGL